MNRRQCIGLSTALLLADDARGTDTAGPATDKILTHVRIRCREDGRTVFGWYHGTMYAQISGERTVPLLHVEGASSSRAQRQADGSWAYRLREAGWFCDLERHAVLEEWRNPLNGRTVRPQHYNSSQQTLFTNSGVTPLGVTLPPGLEYTGYITEPDVQGDDVWTTEELFVRSPGMATRHANIQTSLATLHASRTDLENPRAGFVPSTLAYQTLASWRPWMDMGDTVGVISWRLCGRKCAGVEGIPAPLLERVQREHPDALAT